MSRAVARGLSGFGSFAALWLLPGLAFACPVCFDQNAANRDAFLATTVFLSLLPLAMIGGLAFYLRRRARMLAEPEAARPPSPSDAPPDAVPELGPARG